YKIFPLLRGHQIKICKSIDSFKVVNNRNRNKYLEDFLLNIIILGAGNTGSYLAGLLSTERHNITVIDKDSEKLEKLSEEFDVSVFAGNANDLTTLEKAGLKSADMLIAVTDVDEINIVVCFIADKLKVKTKIARVKSLSYYNKSLVSMEELGVDHMLNPEEEVANDIYNLIEFPAAFEITSFADGSFMHKGYNVDETSKLKGMTIKDIAMSITVFSECIITMIIRDGKVIIPGGDDKIFEGDKVYLVTQASVFHKIAPYFNNNYQPINKIFIVGANNVSSFFIKKILKKRKNIDITVFDKEKKDCEELGKKHKEVKIVNASPTSEYNELVKEGIDEVDAFIAVSEIQDINILSAMIAKKANVRKTIVGVLRPDIFPFYDATSIDSIVSPSVSMTRRILKYVRRGNLFGETPLANKRAEMLEYKVTKKCKILNKPIKDAKLPHHTIIAYIIRDNKIIVPSGDNIIRQGDRLFIFSITGSGKTLKKIFD
ncbi:MAG: Trk system potassium transporter TrkA, partial [Spirochaetota bacterium]